MSDAQVAALIDELHARLEDVIPEGVMLSAHWRLSTVTNTS
jgi:hypothetical protein